MLLTTCCALDCAGPVKAQDAGQVSDQVPTDGELSTALVQEGDSQEPTEGESTTAPYWSRGRSRSFISGRVDVGSIQRALLTAGWGKPNWTYAGAEAFAFSTFDFLAIGANVRANLIVADLALGARWTRSYGHRFVEERPSYVEADIFGSSDSYVAVDMSLSGLVPLEPVFLLWELAALRLLGTPPEQLVFEEYLRVVVRGQWAGVVRAGGIVRLWPGGIAIGALSEVVFPGDRDVVVRVGPLATWQITDHLSATVVLTLPVSSPDRFDAFWGAWGTARLSWMFATDQQGPVLP